MVHIGDFGLKLLTCFYNLQLKVIYFLSVIHCISLVLLCKVGPMGELLIHLHPLLFGQCQGSGNHPLFVTVRPPCQIESGILEFGDLRQDYKDGFWRGVIPKGKIGHVRHHVTGRMTSKDYTSQTWLGIEQDTSTWSWDVESLRQLAAELTNASGGCLIEAARVQ